MSANTVKDSQPTCIRGHLHPFQVTGLEFLKEHLENNISCILADEMGLGKTLQTIALLGYLLEAKCRGPFLVICPLTIVDTWIGECTRFCPALTVWSYSGSKTVREKIQKDVSEHVMSQPVSARKDPSLPFNLLISTYEYITADKVFLSRFKWRVAIVDEAHRLKNSASVLYRTLADGYHLKFKLLLTGTPVQNNLYELWSLLHFIQPKLFSDREEFVAQFGALRTSTLSASARASLAAQLHEVMKPFVLRRMKGEVALGIPEKREVVLFTGMTQLQKQYYKAVLTKNVTALGSSRGLVNAIVSLRKACNHPYLFPGAEPEPFHEGDHLWSNSGKLCVLDQLLPLLKKKGRRVLIFSTSVQTLDILQDYLTYRSFSYERLDGSVRGEERYMAIGRFTTEETFVFLLSTRAGGTGLNLTVADTVIFFDSDFNPQIDLQAQARVHRIGQTKKVLVVRLVTAHTVEEVIRRRSVQKLRMTNDIISKGKFNPASQGDDAEEMEEANLDDLKAILTYGLDSLWDSALPELSPSDLEFIVEGGSRAMEQESSQLSQLDEESLEPVERPSGAEEESIYFYEGRDYKNYEYEEDPHMLAARQERSRAFLESLVPKDPVKAVSSVEGRASKVRRSQTPEEIAELSQLKAKISHDKKIAAKKRQEDKSREMLASLWRASHYDSKSVVLDEKNEEKQNDEDALLMYDEENYFDEKCEINYIIGDATKPVNDKSSPSLVRYSSWPFSSSSSSSLAPPSLVSYNSSSSSSSLAPPSLVSYNSSSSSSSPSKNNQRERNENKLDEEKNQKENETDQGGTWGIGDEEVKTASSVRVNGGKRERDSGGSPLKSVNERRNKPLGSVIINCVDESGTWGRGGFFWALAKLSKKCQESYETAGLMQDLHMGDAHFVQIRDIGPEGALYVCHLVGQKRSKWATVLDREALALGIKKIAQVAAALNLSVHLPRIGAGTEGFDWYGIERLLKRYLCSRGIETYVYYYKRSHHSSSSSSSSAIAADAADVVSSSLLSSSTSSSSTAASSSLSSPSVAPSTAPSDLFNGCMCFVDTRMEPSAKRLLERCVLRYGGELMKTLDARVTHILASTTEGEWPLEWQEAAEAIVVPGETWIADRIRRAES